MFTITYKKSEKLLTYKVKDDPIENYYLFYLVDRLNFNKYK